MKARSPLLGYNHNIRYAGRLYHVQTEDSGLQNPHIFTHLFFGGTILASKRTDYSAEDDDGKVQKLMQAQHKAMLKELRAGTFDARLEKHFGEPVVREPHEIEPADSNKATIPPSLPPTFDEAAAAAAPLSIPPPPAPAPEPAVEPAPAPLPIAASSPSETIAYRSPTTAVDPPPIPLTQPRQRHETPAFTTPVQRQRRETPVTMPPPPTARPPGASRPPPYASVPPPPRPTQSTDPDLRPPTFDPPPQQRPVPPVRRPAGAPPSRSQPISPYGNRPSAEGVVVARPAVIVSDVVPSRAPQPPRRPPPVAAPPAQPPREPVAENIFGEDLVSEKSLDEVILAYLAEDLPGK